MTLIEGERNTLQSVDKEERSNLIDKKETNDENDQVDVKS